MSEISHQNHDEYNISIKVNDVHRIHVKYDI